MHHSAASGLVPGSSSGIGGGDPYVNAPVDFTTAHRHYSMQQQPPQAPNIHYYTPVATLQLPNGEILPYDSSTEAIMSNLTINPMPVGLMMPPYHSHAPYNYLNNGNIQTNASGGYQPQQQQPQQQQQQQGQRNKGYKNRTKGGGGGNSGNNSVNNNNGEDQESKNNNNSNNSNNKSNGRQKSGGNKNKSNTNGNNGGIIPVPKTGKNKCVQNELKDNVKRTVYISDIDQSVTEEELANFFAESGSVVDCRICGDPNSAKRFAFIEFMHEESVSKAIEKSGLTMHNSIIKILPSKTAIVPVNKDFMPRNMEEMELCSRTVYVANIDKKVDKNDVRRFFQSLCGSVAKLRLLGDYAHSTRIAFVEFTQAESALAALNCSGAVLGTLPIRVSPSKAPVRMTSGSDAED